VRIGEHPGATRIVLDISQRTNATFDVSPDGRTLFVVLPDVDWRAGNFAAKHAKGMLTEFRQTKTDKGTEISFLMDEPVRMKSPFFVSPEGNQGDRIVIDVVPDPVLANTASKAAPVVTAKAQPSTAKIAPAQTFVTPGGVTMEQQMVAGPANIVPTPPAKTAPVEVAQTSYTLAPSPSQRPASPVPVQTAQAMPPQSSPPAPDNSAMGGLLYVKAAAGLNVREESNAEGSGTNAAIESDFGWVVNTGLGVDLKNNFRLEGEILYTTNDTKAVTGTLNGSTVNSGQGEGDASLLGFMANLAYDFVTPYAITPYVFGGAGLAMVSLNSVGTSGNIVNDDDMVFAMQAGAGLSTDLTDRTSLDLSYRYLETLKAKMSDAQGTPFDYDYQAHMIMLGLRYKL
jgi:opacity protein-like surface antigen